MEQSIKEAEEELKKIRDLIKEKRKQIREFESREKEAVEIIDKLKKEQKPKEDLTGYEQPDQNQ